MSDPKGGVAGVHRTPVLGQESTILGGGALRAFRVATDVATSIRPTPCSNSLTSSCYRFRVNVDLGLRLRNPNFKRAAAANER